MSVLIYTVNTRNGNGVLESELLRILYDADERLYKIKNDDKGIAITPAELEEWVERMVDTDRLPDPSPLYEYLDWLPDQ